MYFVTQEGDNEEEKVTLGKVIIHSSKLETIGLITIGNIIWEEWLMKNWKVKEREENAYALSLAFVLELTPDFWIKLKDILNIIDSKIDYHILLRMIESCQVKKKS